MLILGALSVVFALTYCTGVLSCLGATLESNLTPKDWFPAGQIYIDAQPVNNLFFYLSIVIILLSCVLYITANGKRRNYYISNYVSSGVVAVADVALSIVILVKNAILYSQVLDYLHDPAQQEAYALFFESGGEFYDSSVVLADSSNTVMFILGFILCALLIIGAVLLVLNCVWKYKLMQGEKSLLEGNLSKEAA